MSLYNKLLRDETKKLKDIPTYLVNFSLLHSFRVDGKVLKFEDISLPHEGQCFVINDDMEESSVSTSVLKVIDSPATDATNPVILVDSYMTFMRDPSGDIIKPIRFFISMGKDESGDCKIDILTSTSKEMAFIRGSSLDKVKYAEAEKMLLQYLYNNILLITHALNTKEVIQGVEKRTIKTSNSKGKKSYSEVEFRHLSLRSYVSKTEGNKNIVWNYSWVVRGHWRYFKDGKMGVNRSGERIERGRTWISEYIKNEGEELDTRMKIIK